MNVISEYLSHQPHQLSDEEYARALDENPMLSSIIFTRMTVSEMNSFRKRISKLITRKHPIVDKYLVEADESFYKDNWNFIQWKIGDLTEEKPTGSFIALHVGNKMRLNYIPNASSKNVNFLTNTTKPYMMKYEPTKQSKYIVKNGDGPKFKVYIDYDVPSSIGSFYRQLTPRWKEEETITKAEFDNIMKGYVYYTISESDIMNQKHYNIPSDLKPINVNEILSFLGPSKTPRDFIKNVTPYDPLASCLKPVLKEYWTNKPLLITKLKEIYAC